MLKTVIHRGIRFLTGLVILSVTSASSCNGDDPPAPPSNPQGELQLLNVYDLDVPEPSGLSFGPGGETLLMVSDNTKKVYETTLQGGVIRTLEYEGDDTEGVTYNPDENIVAVAEERKKEIVFLDYANGTEQKRFEINTGGSTQNKGLEGLSYYADDKNFYMVNEDLPGEMIVWNEQNGIIGKTELKFADDYSGIFVDMQNHCLWIVSDESDKLFRCDFDAKVLKEYKLEKDKFEGVAVDAAGKLVYLVNDDEAKLYIFKIIEK